MITSTRSSPESVRHACGLLAKSERPGFFAFILSAFHTSRCRSAARVLRRYEHLIARYGQRGGDGHRADPVQKQVPGDEITQKRID
ncbi:hypothetical protein [Bradyrhizobium sp. NAS80.1]|uniref:hypothetical protein n=1 Tax=Bradyrhizobium sp. NAS80.1 TaxID=1680159 RepID=UPI001161468D|nr:hypothetical protein [Bradyrhizobium sp. NAS80.1]